MFELLADIASPVEIPVFGGTARLAMSSELQFGRIRECEVSSSFEITRKSHWSSLFSNLHQVVPSDSDAHLFLLRNFIEPQLKSVGANSRLGSVVSAVDGLLMLGEHSKALELISAFKRDPSDFWSNHAYAMALRHAGKLEQSKEVLSQLADASPHDYRALHALGRIYIEENNWDLAAGVFTRAVAILSSIQDSDPLLLNDFATVAIAGNKIDQAIRLLRQAIMEDSHCALALNNLGVCYRKLNKPRRARQYFLTAIKCDSSCAPSIHNLAECEIERNDYRSAATLLENHLLRMPDDLQAGERLSWSYFRLGQIGKAMGLLKDMIKKNGEDPAALNNLAMICSGSNRRAEAEENFIGAINLRRSDEQIKYNYASFLYDCNRWEDVIKLLSVSRDLDRELQHIPSITLLAHAFLKMERTSRAEELLYAHRNKFDEDSRLPVLLSHILIVETDEAEKAIQILLKAVVRFPDESSIANNLAYAYLVIGNTTKAREILAPWVDEKRLPASISGTCIMATWGLLLIQESSLDEGLLFYKRARSQAPGNFIASIDQKMLLEEGRYYLHIGKNELALNKLRQSVKINKVKGFTREANRLIQTEGILN